MKSKTLRLTTAFACLIAVAGLSGCDMISGYFRAKSAAVKWEGDIEEIAFANLVKDGAVFDIEMHSRIDAPVDKVWEAMQHPERLADNSDQIMLSFSARTALDNLQQLTVRIEFFPEEKRMTIKTLTSSIADIDGQYTLEASPDGTKTAYIYTAKQTDKVALPISEDVQRSAIKESFVNQVRAIKKQLGMS